MEPAHTGEELMNGLKTVRPGDGFVPNFPLTWKIDVNGANEHPMYTYMKVGLFHKIIVIRWQVLILELTII